MRKTAISLFTGAGGMDVGFAKAGFDVLWANDIDGDACRTYAENHGGIIRQGDLANFINEIPQYRGIDLVFGGPPCQGFSVAGKMDASDPRSKLIFSFADVVNLVKPQAFVMENVKALGSLSRFEVVRKSLLSAFDDAGYTCELFVLNASDFGVPQARERMFIVGFRNSKNIPKLSKLINEYKVLSPCMGEIVRKFGRAGSETNPNVCKAKITLASRPVLRRSAYAGMLFNGQGRPLDPAGYCSTLPASMGGNRTPIVDEEEIFDGKPSWVKEYHAHLMAGGEPYKEGVAPPRLRRLTTTECQALQTFPIDYKFTGGQNSIYRQIGNAVPCNLAYAVGKMVLDVLNVRFMADPTLLAFADNFSCQENTRDTMQHESCMA
jgi:DNA (cytosine-5)-methyltransferase 1